MALLPIPAQITGHRRWAMEVDYTARHQWLTDEMNKERADCLANPLLQGTHNGGEWDGKVTRWQQHVLDDIDYREKAKSAKLHKYQMDEINTLLSRE